MNYQEFSDFCKKAFKDNISYITVTEEHIEKLYHLTNHMLKVNETMNLTAIKDEKLIILRHYVDSVFISEYLEENSNIIDVGCGAGFPTLPLAIFRPDLRITALDSTAKRIDYVNGAAKMLELNNIIGISERAEVLANNKQYREKFDYATARAVAALPILTELCLPFVKVGGSFAAMKAQKAQEELALSENAIKKCGGELADVISKDLLYENGDREQRSVIVTKKIKPTPIEFPRHYSKISKKPL